MYDGCFGFNRRPFISVPQTDHYFPARAIEDSRTTLMRSIQRGEGAGLIIGASGTGKTLLCLLLAEQFRRSFQVAMLTSGRLGTRRALFQAILYELGRPYRGMDEGELRLAVIDYLTTGDGSSRGMLLLIDEAHTLPLRLLEEIRLLTNLVRGGQPLVRLVLAGAAVLEERFASPKLDSFSQRIVARCYLETFNRTETKDYIHAQVNAVGGEAEQVFPEAACQSVFQATGGVPRLINQVCDHALLLAYVAGRKTIEPANIEEAWADLQQLPTPWAGASQQESSENGVIEFGALDDAAETKGDSTPLFRVASLDEEVDFAEEEPAQQICRIEQLLAEADDDFQPVGSIGPEVELTFDETAHPFHETFQDEEIVVDRYAGAAVAASAGVLENREASGSSALPAKNVCAANESRPANQKPEIEVNAFECGDLSPAKIHQPCSEPAPALTPSDNLTAGGELSDNASMPSEHIPRLRRVEYRQLFSQLRKG